MISLVQLYNEIKINNPNIDFKVLEDDKYFALKKGNYRILSMSIKDNDKVVEIENVNTGEKGEWNADFLFSTRYWKNHTNRNIVILNKDKINKMAEIEYGETDYIK